MRKEIQQLLDSAIGTRELSRQTGVNEASISKLRTGSKDLGLVSLDVAERLYKYWGKLNMKNIRWTGKTTDGLIHYSAEGEGYRDLFENLIGKYGEKIVNYNQVNVKLLKINGEDLEKYEVDSDGIGNWELYEEFESRSDLKDLSDTDYKDIIENSTGNAYYQTFEEEATVAFIEEGDVKETKTGYKEHIIEWTVEILNNMATDYDLDFEDLILDIEQANDTDEILALLEANFNDSTYKFDAQ